MSDKLDAVSSHQIGPTASSLHLENDLRQPYHVPVKYLQGTRDDLPAPHRPDDAFGLKELPPHPTIVFINPKSGGQMGKALAKMFGEVVGVVQVYQLPKQRPDKVLQQIWQNLDAAIKQGDEKAHHIQNNLRAVAAGGDGTYSWLLQAVAKTGIKPQPPCSVIPLGTGNGMSVNLGWGHRASRRWVKDRQSMADMIKGVSTAHIRGMDLWSMTMESGLPDRHQINSSQAAHPAHQNGHQEQDEGSKRRHDISIKEQAPFIDDELPAAVAPKDSQKGSARGGKFCYYLTVGLDAEAAYRFNEVRNNKPHLAKYRWQNIGWYFYEAMATGWLWGAKPLNRKIKSLRIRKGADEEWRDLHIPDSVRAIIMINLQTYMGGCDLWGMHEHHMPEEQAKNLKKPIFDDGLIEIVGLKGALHTMTVLSGATDHIHGARLGQAGEIEILFQMQKGKKGATHMRLDGEPWAQPLPAKGAPEGPLRVHVKLDGSARVLINTHHLPGVNAKALQMSKREEEVSKPEEEGLYKRHSSGSSSSSNDGSHFNPIS